MGLAVCGTAMLKCSAGSAPSVLNVAPVNRCMSKTPLATIMDNKPAVNIMPFGTCANIPQPGTPCVPATAAPWSPGSPSVMIGNYPALTVDSKLICSLGGIIEVANAGQQSITLG